MASPRLVITVLFCYRHPNECEVQVSQGLDLLFPKMMLKIFSCIYWSFVMLIHFNCVWLFTILWTIACQAPLSLGFSRQEYLDGLPFPPPGDLPDPGLKLACLMSLHRQVGSLPLAPPGICLFRSFAHLKKIWLFIFLILSCKHF